MLRYEVDLYRHREFVREAFLTLAASRSDSHIIGMVISEPNCEVKLSGVWTPIDHENALWRPYRDKRCPECHGRVIAIRAGSDGTVAHFEHWERHTGCRLGDCFDGKSTRHPKTLP